MQYELDQKLQLNDKGQSYFRELVRAAINPRELTIYKIENGEYHITVGAGTKWKISSDEITDFTIQEAL